MILETLLAVKIISFSLPKIILWLSGTACCSAGIGAWLGWRWKSKGATTKGQSEPIAALRRETMQRQAKREKESAKLVHTTAQTADTLAELSMQQQQLLMTSTTRLSEETASISLAHQQLLNSVTLFQAISQATQQEIQPLLTALQLRLTALGEITTGMNQQASHLATLGNTLHTTVELHQAVQNGLAKQIEAGTHHLAEISTLLDQGTTLLSTKPIPALMEEPIHLLQTHTQNLRKQVIDLQNALRETTTKLRATLVSNQKLAAENEKLSQQLHTAQGNKQAAAQTRAGFQLTLF